MTHRAEHEADVGQPAPSGSSVKIRGLVKTYRAGDTELRAADHIDLDILPGSFTAITGPSGSGKSTLLQLIGAIDRPDHGTIIVDGLDITALSRRHLPAYRRRIGFVFQRFNLLPALTALDNVLAPTLPAGGRRDAAERAHDLLDAVGLQGRHNALPTELSGGQQQRVAIARALIANPPLLLADEPTGNLDTTTGADILDLLQHLRHTSGTTLLLATHDATIAATANAHISVIDGRITLF